MRTAPSTKRVNNPDVKRAVIALTRPVTKTLQCSEYHTYRLRTTPADPDSPTYEFAIPFFSEGTPEDWIKFRRGLKAVLKGQNVTLGPASYAVAKTLLKGDALTVFELAETTHGNQTTTNFEVCLDDVAAHVFPEKAGQTQKRYMRRNLRYTRDTTVKEWVARVSELNGYLKDFPATNGNPTQPLDKDELLDILEYGVPASWCREFTVQGFDPVDQGLQKFVEFCTHLESCEPSEGKAKGEKPSK